MNRRPNLFRNQIFLWVILTACTIFGLNGLVESQLENEILQSISDNIIHRTKGKSEESQIIAANHLCYFLQERRTSVLGSHDFKSFKATTFQSSLQSYYIGKGACGYYSIFAARVFEKMGYSPLIVQQRVNGKWGAHITLAIPLKEKNKSVLIDPLYNCGFVDSLGNLSSIQEVSENWVYHSKYLPSSYNLNYNYQEGWRYTNWDKLGFFSQAVYKSLCWLYGKEKTDLICVGMWIIDPYRVQTSICFFMAAISIVLLVIQKNQSRFYKKEDNNEVYENN